MLERRSNCTVRKRKLELELHHQRLMICSSNFPKRVAVSLEFEVCLKIKFKIIFSN